MADEGKNNHYCKRCGRFDTDAPLSVSDDVLQEYLRCTLGGRTFSKKFEFGNGKVSMTFEVVPAELNLMLERIIDNTTLSNAEIIDLRMLMSLSEITAFDEQTSGIKTLYKMSLEDRKKLLEAPTKATEALVKNMDSVLLQIVRRINIAFIMLINEITDSLLNKDFYDGVGLL